MEKINVIFMGTPKFAVPILQVLIDTCNVLMVVCQPDKPVGRKKEIVYSPIKELALKNNIEVFQPERIRKEFEPVVNKNADLIVTCAFGQIIPSEILDNPRLGCINVHASLLPKLRGGAPIHKAIIEGYEKTGITLMYMDEGMDTGDMITTSEYIIKDTDTVGILHDELMSIARDLLIATLPDIIAGTNGREKQNNDEVTYAYNIKREEERLDFNGSCISVYNKVRGLNPWPLSNMILDNEEIKVLECFFAITSKTVPGMIVEIKKDAIGIGAEDGIIYLTKIKPFGKKEMLVSDYLNGIDREELLGKAVE